MDFGQTEHWLPALLAVIALGVWAGRLEMLTAYLKTAQEESREHINSIDESGTRAAGVALQRLVAHEASLRTIESRMTELDARLAHVDQRLAVLDERQRQVMGQINDWLRRRVYDPPKNGVTGK